MLRTNKFAFFFVISQCKVSFSTEEIYFIFSLIIKLKMNQIKIMLVNIGNIKYNTVDAAKCNHFVTTKN